MYYVKKSFLVKLFLKAKEMTKIAFVISAAAFVMTLLTMLRPAHDHPPAGAVRQAA